MSLSSAEVKAGTSGWHAVAMTSQHWDSRYRAALESGQTVWSGGPNVFVAREVASLPSPGTAIDLAAGEGRNAIWLAEQGWQVSAVDFSAVGIETGRRVASERGVSVDWVVADVISWAPAQPVDLLVIAYLHLPSAILTPLFARAGSMLNPGGTALVVGHAVENLTEGVGGPQDPDVLYPPDLDLPGLWVTKHELLRRPSGDRAVALDRLLRATRR